MPVIAIAPPTMMATIGIRNGPKPKIESINLVIRSLPQGLKPVFLLRALSGTTEVVPFPVLPSYSFVKLSTIRQVSGGADRDRTGGLLVANQALSQLSYSPLVAISFQLSAISKNRRLRADG